MFSKTDILASIYTDWIYLLSGSLQGPHHVHFHLIYYVMLVYECVWCVVMCVYMRVYTVKNQKPVGNRNVKTRYRNAK